MKKIHCLNLPMTDQQPKQMDTNPIPRAESALLSLDLSAFPQKQKLYSPATDIPPYSQEHDKTSANINLPA
ncbi:MAG: hypothetical protein MI784_03860 [Cytophagales bacterium]|nr:hypothetical protein [Cytophagales bacterium]